MDIPGTIWPKPIFDIFSKNVFFVFFDHFMRKSLPKTQNSKNIENYEVFQKSAKCFNIQLGVEKNFGFFRFCFWPLFVTKNGIFVFFDHFIHKSLPKNEKSKNIENYEVFHKSTKCFNIQLGVEKNFGFFRFCFWPLFVTKNGIFVFFDHFQYGFW